MKECRESPILHILSGDNRGDEEDLHWAVVFHTSSINPNIFSLMPETQVGMVIKIINEK